MKTSTTASTGQNAAHPAVRAYAQRNGIDASAFREDGRVTLTIDDRFRVQLRAAADGRLALSSLLLDLGQLAAPRVDATLQRLAIWAAGMMRDHASALAVDEGAQALLLQQELAANTDLAALESELADFVNVLAFWVSTCARETAAAA
jgi:hypothetical protein